MEDLNSSDWGYREASGSKLADRRFQRVLAEVLAAKFEKADVSFSHACGSALRQAAGRLLRKRKTGPDDLLAGHGQATLERCMGLPLIAIAQDSTSYNLSGLKSVPDLGPTNDREGINGIHQHSALAMTEDKVPLGVVSAKFWVRPKQVGSAKKRTTVPTQEKESVKWLETADRVEELFEPYFAQGGRAVLIGDRECDVFDLLAKTRHPRMDLLIRAAYRRTVKMDGTGEKCVLLEAAGKAKPLGDYDIDVPAKPGQAARVAHMELRSAFVWIQTPKTGVGHSKSPVSAWVVTAKEVVPEGGRHEPLNWTLITTMDASTMSEARRVVNLYTCRWQIERLHFTIKSGCRAERLQMGDKETLIKTLALYLIVAWRLLYVTHMARGTPDAPAAEVFDETEIAVLSQQTRTQITSIHQAVTAIAKMAGYEPYRDGPPPGVKTLWLGIRQLEAMAYGWRLAMEAMRLTKM